MECSTAPIYLCLDFIMSITTIINKLHMPSCFTNSLHHHHALWNKISQAFHSSISCFFQDYLTKIFQIRHLVPEALIQEHQKACSWTSESMTVAQGYTCIKSLWPKSILEHFATDIHGCISGIFLDVECDGMNTDSDSDSAGSFLSLMLIVLWIEWACGHCIWRRARFRKWRKMAMSMKLWIWVLAYWGNWCLWVMTLSLRMIHLMERNGRW